MPARSLAAPYDALLLVSFGGPERGEDVLPFLTNVTRGRGIPEGRLHEVARHYLDLGGRSPINDQCRALLAAVRHDLAEQGIELPVYWGNRNWDPYLRETLATMAADGVRRVAAFVTSAYASYSGCRQYRENLFDAVDGLGASPQVDRLRHYFNHPGFVRANVDAVLASLETLDHDRRPDARLVFVTHSIPLSMAAASGPGGGAYQAQHLSTAGLVADGVRVATGLALPWELAYCSRSGPPEVPWLEPDINDHLEDLRVDDCPVVVSPIGFVSDHMEVAYDLDTEAAETAASLGISMTRAATAGVHPAFVAMIRELLLERAAAERGDHPDRAALGGLGPSWDLCAANCCPNPRASRPALCEAPSRVSRSAS